MSDEPADDESNGSRLSSHESGSGDDDTPDGGGADDAGPPSSGDLLARPLHGPEVTTLLLSYLGLPFLLWGIRSDVRSLADRDIDIGEWRWIAYLSTLLAPPIGTLLAYRLTYRRWLVADHAGLAPSTARARTNGRLPRGWLLRGWAIVGLLPFLATFGYVTLAPIIVATPTAAGIEQTTTLLAAAFLAVTVPNLLLGPVLVWDDQRRLLAGTRVEWTGRRYAHILFSAFSALFLVVYLVQRREHAYYAVVADAWSDASTAGSYGGHTRIGGLLDRLAEAVV